MSFIDFRQFFYKSFYLMRYKIVFSLLAMVSYLFYITNNYITGIELDVSLSTFDVLCDVYQGFGVIGVRAYSFPVIPIFVFILVSLIDWDNKINFLFRYKKREDIWKKQVVFTTILAFLFSVLLIIAGYIFSIIILKKVSNNWTLINGMPYKLLNMKKEWYLISNNFMTYKVLLFVFISSFLGLCAMGLLSCVLKTLIKNTYMYAMIIIINFTTVFNSRVSLLLKQMIVGIGNLINPRSILINNLYLLLFIFSMYFLGKKIILNKDYVSKI